MVLLLDVISSNETRVSILRLFLLRGQTAYSSPLVVWHFGAVNLCLHGLVHLLMCMIDIASLSYQNIQTVQR